MGIIRDRFPNRIQNPTRVPLMTIGAVVTLVAIIVAAYVVTRLVVDAFVDTTKKWEQRRG